MDSKNTAIEIFDIVDEKDQPVGQASRQEVHGNPSLIHRVAHVLVFDDSGELFLQKRSLNKDVQPGKWDSSVGGHVDKGESYHDAALREMREELGIDGVKIEFMYKYLHRNDYESEYVSTYRCLWDGPIDIQREEIDEGRFWPLEKIRKTNPLHFTPNFLDELKRLEKFSRF